MADDEDSSGFPDSLTNSSPISLQMTFIENDYDEDDDDSALGGGFGHSNHRSEKLHRFDRSEQFEDFGLSNGWNKTPPSCSSTPKTNSFSMSRKLPSLILNELLKSTEHKIEHSEEIFGDIDGSFNELHEKVETLENQVATLMDRLTAHEKKQIRMKEENSFLVQRVNLLEEQLIEVESKSQEMLEDEKRKGRQLMERTDKEKNAEIELLTHSLQYMESEFQLLKEEGPRLRLENERLRKECALMRGKLNDTDERLSELSAQHDELATGCQEERNDIQQERVIHQQLFDELSEEVEELRLYKEQAESKMSHSAPLSTSMRYEYDSRIASLKQEVCRLRAQKEELLEAQLVGSDLQEGRCLVAGSNQSLADEIHNLSKDQLMSALREYQEANTKLREYLDRITLRIIENHPNLLEISKS